MALENKLNITDSTELARVEEKISKKKAVELFENGYLDTYEAGSFQMLVAIHRYLFDEIYDFAGKIRNSNIAKGNFRFAPVMYLQAAIENVEKMPQSTFDEIIEKYVEMNIVHPFREENGRSARIWLDLILKRELKKVIDWSTADKEDYLLAMERSPIKDIEIRQYHPEYVKLLLQNMLEPYYGTGKEKMRAYSFHNYQELAVYVMQEARGPRIFKREEFADRLGISSYKLDQILQDVAYDADSINVDFSYYLDATNSWRKPLVRLDADTYFCLDGRMEGYAFYEAMFQIIFARYGTVFSKYQGERLEEMVYQMFREKHFPYITGQYLPDGDLPERNCDMILEGSERVMFVEIKKCPLPGSYEQADDVDVLKTLGEGMLYAQEQILWHKLRLKEKGALVLYDKERNYLQDYTPGKKKIIAMSICMPEYDFLTDRMMTETFLESTLRVTYHAIDPSREKVLNKLNKRVANIQMVTARLFAGEKYTTRDVFFDSMFRSLQQVWTMLRMCDSLDMFLDMCDTQLVVITGAGDVYVDILSALHLHQSRSNKSLV